MRKKRKELVLRRKNFLPTLVIIFVLWLLLASLVYFIEPTTFSVIPLFFVIFFLALFFTFSTIFANTRRGLLAALGLTLFLILRYFGIGNILNFLLILGVLITIELYFWKTS